MEENRKESVSRRGKRKNPIRFPSHTQEGSDTREKYGINFLLRNERTKSTLEYKMIS